MEKPGRGGGKKKAAAGNQADQSKQGKGKKSAEPSGPVWAVGRILNNGRRFRVGDAGDLPKHYSYCPVEYLDWSYRSRNLIREIEEMDADIVCLQEVDHFKDFWSTEMGRRGYESAYKQRTGGKDDGCATFWKRDKFVLRSRSDIEYNKLAEGRDLNMRFLTNNVALLVVLDALGGEREDGNAVLLANTHIWWNTKAMDVQLAQTECVLRAIDEAQRVAPVTAILCGDLNSTPGTAPHLAAMQWNKSALRSSYAPLEGDPSASPFTVFRPAHTLTIDFLFYQHDMLEVTQLLEEKLKAFDGCPNRRFSSDHLSLMAHFRFRVAPAQPAAAAIPP